MLWLVGTQSLLDIGIFSQTYYKYQRPQILGDIGKETLSKTTEKHWPQGRRNSGHRFHIANNIPIEVADEFPQANFCRIDISPIQRHDVPNNVHWIVSDLTEGLPLETGVPIFCTQGESITTGSMRWIGVAICARFQRPRGCNHINLTTISRDESYS